MTHLNDPFNFKDLESTPQEVLAHTRKGSNQQKFPCPECLGTGLYQGARVHQEKSHCFACKGKGYFKTDPRKLADRRNRKVARKQNMKQSLIDQFKSNQPEMFKELAEAYARREGSGFIVSLADQLFERGSLSENQVDAWHRGKEKLEAIRAQKAKDQKEAQVSVDLTPIRSMFETAVVSGYKKPKYRAEGLVINRAPDTGSNPGALYVKNESGVYLGKITGTTYHPNRDGRESGAAGTLLAIAQDPLEAALRYGQRTGRCACCGRELTKHTSIDLGIGPVCKEKWGL